MVRSELPLFATSVAISKRMWPLMSRLLDVESPIVLVPSGGAPVTLELMVSRYAHRMGGTELESYQQIGENAQQSHKVKAAARSRGGVTFKLSDSVGKGQSNAVREIGTVQTSTRSFPHIWRNAGGATTRRHHGRTSERL